MKTALLCIGTVATGMIVAAAKFVFWALDELDNIDYEFGDDPEPATATIGTDRGGN